MKIGKWQASAAVVGAATAILAAGAVPATAAGSAGVSPRLCVQPGTYYETTQTGRYISKGAIRAYGQGGGTATISKGLTTTTSGSLQTTVSAEAGVIFAKASTSVGVTIGLSKSVTATVSYSYAIPASVGTGWVEMGAHGYQINWERGHYISPCTWVRESSGQLLGTTSSVQFIHS